MVEATRILITGPTGNVGSAVLDDLSTTDINLRTLAHNESKAKALRDRGVGEAVVGISLSRRPWDLLLRA